MQDSFGVRRVGDKRPDFATFTAAAGDTLTVSGQPTFTLYDSTKTKVVGFDGINVTGFDSGAKVAPRLWYDLDLAALPSGWYTELFKGTATSTLDGMLRNYEVNRSFLNVPVTD